MTQQEKLALLEDMMELDEGTLAAETALAEIDEYDSMAKLNMIVLFDDECDKKLTADQIKAFVTVGDILNAMD